MMRRKSIDQPEKEYICSNPACRAQLACSAMIGNVAGFCPHCGNAVRLKSVDRAMQRPHVERARMGGSNA